MLYQLSYSPKYLDYLPAASSWVKDTPPPSVRGSVRVPQLKTPGKYLEAQTRFRHIGWMTAGITGIVLQCGGLAAGCARTRPAPSLEPHDPQYVDAPSPVASGPMIPLAASFGTFDGDNRFARASRIPKVEGQSFGWRIKTRCTGPVRFREVMSLPAPGDWSLDPEEQPGTTISDDQTTTTTIDYAACKQGWVEHVWTVAAGDPAGTYVITVELDGYATQTFRPTFVTPERG